jgi:protein TonB
MQTRIFFLLALSLATLGTFAGQSHDTNRDSSKVSATAAGDYASDETFAPYQRISKDMTPPKATHSPDPQFPNLAADAEQRGIVVMLVGVNAKGRVEPVRVLRSSAPAFETSAVDTVKKWKFKPAKKGGQPVPVQITVEMTFRK